MKVKADALTFSSATLTADRTTTGYYVGQTVNYAIQLVIAGTPTGTFKLQASIDAGRPEAATEADRASAVTNWTDIADSSVSGSAAGDVMWDVANSGYLWVRVVYTFGSSTGTVTGRISTKGA